MKSNPLKLKFLPKTGLILAFYVLLAATMYLLLSKSKPEYRLPVASFNGPELYSHVSNFIITYNIIAALSLIWLLQGVGMKAVVWLCLVFVVLNLIAETVLTVMNTPDLADAVFGIAGAVLAFGFALAGKKYGLKDYVQQAPDQQP